MCEHQAMGFFISGWRDVPDEIDPLKDKNYHQNPLSRLALFVLDWAWGKRCYPNCLLCLNTFFVVQVLFCVLGPNSCQ